MYDGSWQLIDLDGSVRIGLAIGAKDLSTAYIPPEAVLLLGDGTILFRVPAQVEKEEMTSASSPQFCPTSSSTTPIVSGSTAIESPVSVGS